MGVIERTASGIGKREPVGSRFKASCLGCIDLDGRRIDCTWLDLDRHRRAGQRAARQLLPGLLPPIINELLEVKDGAVREVIRREDTDGQSVGDGNLNRRTTGVSRVVGGDAYRTSSPRARTGIKVELVTAAPSRCLRDPTGSDQQQGDG